MFKSIISIFFNIWLIAKIQVIQLFARYNINTRIKRLSQNSTNTKCTCTAFLKVRHKCNESRIWLSKLWMQVPKATHRQACRLQIKSQTLWVYFLSVLWAPHWPVSSFVSPGAWSSSRICDSDPEFWEVVEERPLTVAASQLWSGRKEFINSLLSSRKHVTLPWSAHPRKFTMSVRKDAWVSRSKVITRNRMKTEKLFSLNPARQHDVCSSEGTTRLLYQN